MSSDQTFVLQDEASFVVSFDLNQQKLIMTQDRSEAYFFTLSEALEVVRRLGWLASKRLVLKAIEGTVKSR